jgi:phosphoribosylglycinamide formyltransferase-1
MNTKKQIAIFASGSGSNAELLIQKSRELDLNYEVKLIVTNSAKAGVIERAHRLGIPIFVWEAADIAGSENFISFLKKNEIDYIVLAGYLKKIEGSLVQHFENKIVNIHPSLLPKYGGKGMYGHHVHEAVIAAKESESGITIHYVNEHYDEGTVIAQFTCALGVADTVESLQKKIQTLEHENFYQIVHNICK